MFNELTLGHIAGHVEFFVTGLCVKIHGQADNLTIEIWTDDNCKLLIKEDGWNQHGCDVQTEVERMIDLVVEDIRRLYTGIVSPRLFSKS